MQGALVAADLYVAPNGSDLNPGTERNPFATFERARDEIRKLKSVPPRESRHSSLRITVWIRGGDYSRTNTLELGTIDSGTPDAPITWRAWKGETARLLGGRNLSFSALAPITNAGILNRLSPQAREHVQQLELADFSKLVPPNQSLLVSRGFGRAQSPVHCGLFFDGKPMILARWRNEGSWEHIAGFPEGGAENDSHGGNIGKLEQGFFYSGDRPRAWKDPGTAWVHGYWAWDWANSYEHVDGIDLD